jgi:hypothetical protein
VVIVVPPVAEGEHPADKTVAALIPGRVRPLASLGFHPVYDVGEVLYDRVPEKPAPEEADEDVVRGPADQLLDCTCLAARQQRGSRQESVDRGVGLVLLRYAILPPCRFPAQSAHGRTTAEETADGFDVVPG